MKRSKLIQRTLSKTLSKAAVQSLEYLSKVQTFWITKATPQEVKVEYLPGRIWTIHQWTFREQTNFLSKWRDKLDTNGLPKDSSLDFQFHKDLLQATTIDGPEKLTDEAVEKGHGGEMRNLVNVCFLFNLANLGVGRPLSAPSKSGSPTTSQKTRLTRMSPQSNATRNSLKGSVGRLPSAV